MREKIREKGVVLTSGADLVPKQRTLSVRWSIIAIPCMRGFVPISTCAAVFAAIALGQTSPKQRSEGVPVFTAFAVRDVYNGPAAAPKYLTAADERYLGPVLGSTISAPDFAGHFRVVQFRIGSGPLGAVVVDAVNGTVFHLPARIVRDRFFIHDTDCLSALSHRKLQKPDLREEEDDSTPLSFRIDSELLIVRQCRMDASAVTAVTRNYYRWNRGRWQFLKMVAVAPPPVL
jgi:hypothetical protein